VNSGNPGGGSVNYIYSIAQDGIYSATVPSTAGTYWVKAIVAATTNYLGGESAAISFAIDKATPTGYTAPTGLSATVGQTLSEVSLSGFTGFSWDTEQNAVTTSVGGTGNRTFKVQYTPTDTTNYNVVKNISVSIAVSYPTGIVTVTFTGPADENITLTESQNISWVSNQTLSLTVSGYASYKWYIDGDEVAGATTGTLSRTARNYGTGIHHVTVRVIKNPGAIPYTKTVTFTVQ
jgi:hypothetical protein